MATRKAITLVSGLFQEVNTPTDKLDFAGNTTADLSENTNLYFTNTRARSAVSVTDSGGFGSLSYNNSTGVITYVGTSNSDVRGILSVASGSGLTYNSSTGEFGTSAIPNSQLANDDVTIGSTAVALGATASTIAGLTSLASTTLISGTANAANSISIASGNITFEGSSADGNETILTAANATGSDKTLTLPNETGTILTTASSIANSNLANSAVTIGGTSVSLGATQGTFTGLTSLASTTLISGAANGANSITLASGNITFEGSTADGNEIILTAADASGSDKTITLPNATGTVALLSTLSIASGSGLTYNSGTGEFSTNAIPNSKLANSSVTVGSTAIALGNSSTTLAGLSSVTSTAIVTNDSGFRIRDNSDNTKQLAFECSGISGSTTRTLTVPDANDTLAVLAAAQTLTNKTIALGDNTVTGALANGITATTQSASDNTTKVATTAYVTTAINNLINGAPAALNTLNELAAAMNDDAAFSTTVTNSLATKMPLAGGQFTGNITFSGSQTVDGRDLSVDGSKLDGIESGATADQTAAEIKTLLDSNGIVNSNVDASAAIAGTKISPNFGSQNIATTGGLRLTNTSLTTNSSADELVIGTTSGNRGLTIFSGTSNTGNIFFGDTNTSGTGNRMGTITYDHSGNFMRFSTDGNQERIRIDSDGLDVTGNISVSGTVDGRDIATDGSKLDGIASGATNVTNTNQLTNGAGFLTSVGTSNISNDAVTFDKIENIATGGIMGRNNSGTGSMERLTASEVRTLINVENGATADQTASEILTLIKTVDGSGSGLDADTVDGIAGGSFLRGDVDDTTTAHLTFNRSSDAKFSLQGSNNPYFDLREGTTEKVRFQWNSGGFIEITNKESNEALRIASGSNGLAFVEGGSERTVYHTGNLSEGDGGLTTNNFTDADHSKLNGIESGATADQSASEILTLIKTVDGSGSGLDADTLDGVSSGSFVRSDGDDSQSGVYAFTSTSNDVINFTGNATSDSRGIAFNSRTALSADYNDGYLRLNQGSEFSNGVYTPGVFRADGGFNTDGNTVINGSGNYVRALSGASDYSSLLRSNAADTASGDITFSGGAGAVTVAANSDIRFTNGNWTGNSGSVGKIQMHSNYLYIVGGTGGIRFREDATDRWHIDGSGHFEPAADSTYDIGESGRRVRNGYFDTLYGDGSNLTGVAAGAVGGGSDEIFYENGQTVTTSYTITNNKNAMAAGPITINSGATVTVGSGENLIIL